MKLFCRKVSKCNIFVSKCSTMFHAGHITAKHFCYIVPRCSTTCTRIHIRAREDTHPHPMLFCHLNVASSQNFLFFLFFYFCIGSTHGDEALVGRVTVNAIFLGDTYCGVPFFVYLCVVRIIKPVPR